VHFLAGVLFVLAISALLLCYLILIPLGFVVIYWAILAIREGNPWWALNELKKFYRPKVYLRCAVIFTLLNLVILVNQRVEWMGDDNANLTAKEYYAAGQVLYFYRTVLADFVRPGKYRIFKPLDWLQRAIYDQGCRYLPDDDAEAAIWHDIWLVYPYSKRLLTPRPIDVARNFLDEVWQNLETLATKPLRDRQMYLQHYLRNYAGMAHFYAYTKHYYVDPGISVARRYVQRPEYIERDERLVGYLFELKEKWQKEPDLQRFIDGQPKVAVMRQVALLMQLVDIIDARVWSKTFNCDDPYFAHYLEVRREFAEGDGKAGPAYKRMASRKEAEQFYEVAVNSVIARFAKYVLQHYCGVGEVAGQADMRLYTGGLGMTAEKYEEYSLRKSLFIPEIKLIEEQMNGRK
jgi:hypothetical protein